MSVWLAALIGLACGLGIGLLNGFITLCLKIPSFIATLGTMGIWEAAVLFVHGATEQTFDPGRRVQRASPTGASASCPRR